ncbi:MAG: hypothetical protein WBY88_06545, partial [Desulfosarcina sp.]
VSPGAALVFLMTGPATNVTSLTVLVRVLGKRATAIYLTAIAFCAVSFGLLVDWVYAAMGISAQAIVGQTTEAMPPAVETMAAILILVMSIKPVGWFIRRHLIGAKPADPSSNLESGAVDPCPGST